MTLAAVYLGAGPATLTALIGLAGSSRWFLLQGQLKFERSDLAYSAGFLLVSSIIILLAERSRRALLQVEAARQTLEEKVDERTRELQVALPTCTPKSRCALRRKRPGAEFPRAC